MFEHIVLGLIWMGITLLAHDKIEEYEAKELVQKEVVFKN